MPIKSSGYIYIPIICLMVAPRLAYAFDDVAGTASVIDGDTLEIHGTRIRLHGIDAPETRQLCKLNGKSYRCGQQAAIALDRFIANRSVRCEGKGIDRYKRLLAVCYLKDANMNVWLVQNGWALAYRKYSMDYVDQEEAARVNRAGMWQGEFEEPWEFRRNQKAHR